MGTFHPGIEPRRGAARHVVFQSHANGGKDMKHLRCLVVSIDFWKDDHGETTKHLARYYVNLTGRNSSVEGLLE